MKTEKVSITNHKGVSIVELIIPDNNSAQSAELLAGQINGKIMLFYDTSEDKIVYGVIKKGEKNNEA